MSNRQRLCDQELAAVVAEWSGRSELWSPALRFLPGQRWSGLLARADLYDVWLLTWPAGTGTELHDHGDSAGAFQVLAGELEELSAGDRPYRRRHRAGSRACFSAPYIHQVRNPEPATQGALDPAVSVHVYSPPLESMTYYQQSRGSLVGGRSELILDVPLLAAPVMSAGDARTAGVAA